MEIQDLLEKANIVEYISQYIELTKVGEEWWGLSCFKDENTPSFSIRENPPVFYDYSSGIGGNLYTFIKQYHKCSAPEAVQKLKEFVGFDGEIVFQNEKLDTTLRFKKFERKKSLRKPNISKVLPDDFMEKYEKREDKLAVWEAEGISKLSLDKYQVYYDAFADRLVYPIRNADGKIVNVGGRTLDKDWKEKGLRKYCYYFKWGSLETIYGLSENLMWILKKKEIIIFEGCKSVLLADTWGIRNTAAILTSHLNPSQMKLLAKLGCDVVFALDKDVSVRADKSIQKLKQYVNVSYIWDGTDLLDEKDSPVDKGKEVFKTLYENKLRL